MTPNFLTSEWQSIKKVAKFAKILVSVPACCDINGRERNIKFRYFLTFFYELSLGW